MKANIEIWDNTDADLLSEAILLAVHELATLRDNAKKWGCSTMELQDRIDRYMRMLDNINEE